MTVSQSPAGVKLAEADVPPAKYVDADSCAARYLISKRHWLRLVDSGRAPQPTRFGRLVRWEISSLERWENAGCPTVRSIAAKGGRNG